MTLGVLLGAVGVVTIVALVVWRRRHVEHLHRLGGLIARLDPSAAPEAPRTLDDGLRQLAWAVEEHHAASESSEQAIARLACAIDLVPVPLVVSSIDGGVVRHNVASQVEERLSHTGPIVRAALADALTAALDGRSDDQPLRLFGPPRRSLRVIGRPLVADGDLVGALAYVLDHSETERIHAVRRDFVANLSHELKTPIGAISLLAETLQDEDDPEVRRRLLERTEREALRMADLVDDLLELAELESSAEALPLDPVPAADVVLEAADRVAHTAAARGSKVLADDLHDVHVLGDRRMLVRAVVNLLENAVKYSDDDAEVRIETRLDVGAMVDIAVIDQGLGISPKHLDRIFERFYRVDRARSRATGGTGLGLSIVKHAAERHGGEVLVESTEAVGSTFVLRLPLAGEEPDRSDHGGTT
ncbi:MAG: ATP-binding protein [Actinomycetota bacterium]